MSGCTMYKKSNKFSWQYYIKDSSTSMLNPVSKYVCRERLRINVLVSFKVLHAKKTSCSKNVSHGAPLHCYSFSRMIFTRILCVHAVACMCNTNLCAVPCHHVLSYRWHHI